MKEKVVIVKSPTRVDIYSATAEYIYSVLPEPDILCEIEDESLVTDASSLNVPYVMETDESLVYYDNNEKKEIPLREIFEASLDTLCDELDKDHQKNSFFKMSQKLRNSLKKFLFVCFQEVTRTPEVISVPIFALYDNTNLDDTATDLSRINTHYLLKADRYSEAKESIENKLSEYLSPSFNGMCFVRSALLRDSLKGLIYRER